MKNIEEIYYYIKENTKLPKIMLTYTTTMDDDSINPFNSIFIDLKEDEKNIEKMKEISEKDNFWFFNDSKEGEDFWDEVDDMRLFDENGVEWEESLKKVNPKI